MSDLTKDEVVKTLAAAEFAAACSLCLDVMVTLDFGRMSVVQPVMAKLELNRFLKAANSWLAERSLPVAWIACIERNKAGNLHAHIAMHVPGMLKNGDDLTGVRHRTHFRIWAREAIARRIGEIVPRAVNVRCSLEPSMIAHWICVGYLLKGYDQTEVLVGARNTTGGDELLLGDILPFSYRSPGDVGLDRRLFISGNLGPSRRMIGAPPCAEFTLAKKANLAALQITSANASAVETKPFDGLQHRPFRAAVEDGIFDIDRIYGTEFAEFVTGIKHMPPAQLEELQT